MGVAQINRFGYEYAKVLKEYVSSQPFYLKKNMLYDVESIGEKAFLSNTYLTSAIIPDNITSIGNSAFSGCSSLESVTVLSTAPPTLGTSVFNSTSSNLVIYVPAESVDTYKAATNWSSYASKIQAIPNN